MNRQPLVSLVILTWNRKEDTIETLQKLRDQTYRDFEIVVVDNNSTDGVDDVIEKEFPDIRLIRLPKNLGVAGGRNVGIKNTRGKIVVFLDNDAIMAPDALEIFLTEFSSAPEIGVVTAKIMNFYTGEISPTDWLHPYNYIPNSERSFFSPIFVGCCSALRKEIFEKIGFFPDDFFRQDEEIDLCVRLMDAGYRIKYCPNIVVYHKQSLAQRSLPFQFYNSTKNNLSVVWKYLPFMLALKQTAVRLFVLGVRGIQKGYFLAYLRGVAGFAVSLPGIIRKRKCIKAETLKEVRRLWRDGDKLIYRLLW